MPSSEKTSTGTAVAGIFSSPEKRDVVLCLLLAVITLALYNPVSRHPFINYDDDRYVTENPHVRTGLTRGSVSWALTSTEQGNWHPLAWISHEIDVSMFRLNPAGHHFISVLLHALNVILLFLLLVRATDRAWPSLYVAILFAVHPINVESVAWIAERKNVLCTLFFLLTLIAYGWYARKPGWQRYLAVVVAFAAGLASKPMAVTLPFVLLLWDYWPLGRMRGGDSKSAALPTFSWTRLVLEKIPLFALSAASAVITVYAQRAGGAVRSIAQFSFSVRGKNAICAYAIYLWKMAWPMRLALVYPHPGDSLAAWRVLFAGLVLMAITAGVYRLRKRRYFPVGWLWFLGTLVPVIGLVQVGDAAMADRYAYIPLIGILIMISFGAADFAAASNVGLAWQAVPAVTVTVFLAVLCHWQIGYWESSESVWAHALAITQNNFIAEDNLGGALVMAGNPEQAFPHFEAASLINPRDPMSRMNIGAYLQSHGHVEEATAQYNAAIELTSDTGLRSQAYANLGGAQRALGDDEAARQSFDEALRLNPNQASAWVGKGLLAQEQGRLDEAIEDLSRGVALQPTGEHYLDLGRTLQQTGRLDEAAGAYRRALKLSPNLTEAQRALDELSARQP